MEDKKIADEVTYYHASEEEFSPGDIVEPGHPANFGDEPSGFVFLSDNMESAEFWADFLGGDSRSEILGYWPEIKIYTVVPLGSLEPDPWCEYHDVRGCYRSEQSFRVTGEVEWQSSR